MEIKRGDSFLLALVVKVDGVAQDLTNWGVSAAISPGFGVVTPLTVSFTDRVNGAFELSAETSDWPIGWMSFDIRYTTDADQIVTTETVKAQVIQGITP
jgi:hypothetical protein